MDFGACRIIHWEHEAKAKTRGHISNRFQVKAKAHASQKAILAGGIPIQFRFTNQFEHGNYVLHSGQWQFAVRNCAGKIKTIFKSAQPPGIPAAKECGIAEDRLA